jgi:asparagine synthase (glutamine-hydrolysing)
MCGICGIVQLGRPPQVETIRAMADSLAHRGPDSDGHFAAEGVALGFRRLAIIDLSDEANQPFASADGTLQLVFNGEIYNYIELRRELEARGHVFRTSSDTEVLLAAYREWGDACVQRFNGMWALAIWETQRRRLFASRDRFGVKPFYYSHAGGRFAFASEPKAFRADPETSLEANPSVVLDYLDQAYLDHTEETFFSGITKLPPGHSLTFDADGLRIHRYWQLEPQDAHAGDAAEAIRELFLDSVRLRLRSDVPVGTCLSGGLDSSAVAVTVDYLLRTEAEHARPVGERQRTFTAYFEEKGYDERPFARAVVERIRAEAHWISFDAEELVADLPAIVETQDEPFGSTSMAAQWYVMRAAKQAGITVTLDGQGGDEVLGGYRAFIGFRLADLLAHGRLVELGREFGSWRDMHGTGTLAVSAARPFAPEALTRLIRSRTRGAGPLVGPALHGVAVPSVNGVASFDERLRRHQALLLTQRGLPELLRYEDRNSMAHSLEARVPFLDYRFVELAFSLAGGELIRGGRTKDVLRRALSDLLPEPVRDRRDKLGFVTPEKSWLRGPLGDLAADVFASTSFVQRGFVDAAAARRRLEQHRQGQVDAGFELWRALNLELWARTFLDG